MEKILGFRNMQEKLEKIVVFHSRWETTGIDALYTQLWLLWVILHEHEPTTAMLLPPRRPKISKTLISLSGCINFIYFEKATKFWKIFTLLLTGTTEDKSKVKILQNFVALSEYMNFNVEILIEEKSRQYCNIKSLHV